MSIPVPLSVRLKTIFRDVYITHELDDLAFGTTSPGGYDTCTLTLHRSLAFTPGELDVFGRLYVYDAGGIVWEGRLQDPGRTAGNEGETYQVAAIGGVAHLQDRTQPYIVIDAQLDRFELRQFTAEHPKREARVDEDSAGNPAIWLTAPTGTSWASNHQACMVYPHIREAGQKLGAYTVSGDCGRTTAGIWRWRTVTRDPGGVGTVDRDVDFTTGGIAASQREVGDSFPDGDDQLELRIQQTNAATQTPNDDTWAIFAFFGVTAKLITKAGVERGSAYNYNDRYVLADEVVEDVLGRLLPEYDGANATVSTAGSYQIDQLAYPDGVTPAQVLEDVRALEVGFTYHVWEGNPDNGDKFRFEWVPWPTTVRYEADVTEGFSAPASGNTIYNKCRVRYRDTRGNIRSVLETRSVGTLTAAGFDRTAFLDLGDEASSLANATRAGDQFLQEHQFATNAGRLTISKPIVDHDTGRMVQPWEIRAGSLIRVRGVESYPDALNRDGRDGLTIFKVAATSYSASEAAVTLDLDAYAPSVSRALAALAARPQTRRR
ncbi:MAG TPA: hypothetical protein VFF37_14470 [Streptomyces sp.]|nr:hypothetical protein [Streptomyces sp.]